VIKYCNDNAVLSDEMLVEERNIVLSCKKKSTKEIKPVTPPFKIIDAWGHMISL
jgi:hypothetical protein